MFGCQCFGQRLFHYPFQCPEAMQVVGQSVVLDQSSVCRLVKRNDAEVAIIDEFRSVEHFSAVWFVSLAFVFDDLFRDSQSNPPVERSSISSISVGILLKGMDFVVEKPRGFCPRMGNQGFGFCKF